jgi:hypothetical protein
MLGTGVATRLGFALWFVIPAAAFLSDSIWTAVVAFAVYGMFRTSFGLFLFPFTLEFPPRIFPDWFPSLSALHTASALVTLIVGIVALVVFA